MSIAIMHDGRVVQTGTPEEIVMNPADDYVANFVAGISRLKVVRAHAVMQPVKKFEAANGKVSKTVKSFEHDADLSILINHAISTDEPIAVHDEKGKRIGIITRADLLRTVIEGTETS